MGSPVISDFNLKSEGHCFFCLSKIQVKVKQESELVATPHFQNQSVHYLARYLEMDMGKVLNKDGQIDSTLLTKVRRSRLKVELCDKCASLNNIFSGLYRQLEKLEIEISSNVRLIQEQLLGADRSDQHKTNLTKFHLNSSMISEVTQIVDVLREEASQKCSQKVCLVSPRVKIDKLTKKQINNELLKRQTNPVISKMEPEIPSLVESINPEANIKTEIELQNENLMEDNNDANESSYYDIDDEAMMEDETTNSSEGPRDGLRPNDLRPIEHSNKNDLVITSPASTTTSRVGKGQHSINPETGKWKCSACPKEFISNAGVNFHHKSAHQNIRFKCDPCGKEFTRKTAYNQHHRTVHVGVRFKCLVCNKLFARRGYLQQHQSGTGCVPGRRYLS